MLTPLRCFLAGLLCLVVGARLFADGAKDNLPDQVRPIPPVGIEVSPQDRAELKAGLAQLDATMAQLKKRSDAQTQRLLPDVEIFSRAVRQGLEDRELYSQRDVENAKKLLQEGQSRADALLKGAAPWTTQKGLVVRGFRSRIDRTVQPYGLVIPESYNGAGKERYRLDVWLHGRGERSTESVFIAQRMTQVGRYAPRDTIVLHPYGRYSNAFKFAGEIDVLEALADAERNYRVDEDRVAIRGFSMGGAGCWQMAVHYADLFFAANPGAGFVETPEFLKFFQQETLHPTWYEKTLWRMYDCPGYVLNLYQLPTVAYSGELDIQKQAADVMEQAFAAQGLRLTHIIGPKTKHAIHPDAARIIEAKLDRIAEQGRPSLPREIRFATYTLKYNRMYWLTVTELGAHWEQATVIGRISAAVGGSSAVGGLPEENTVELKVHNVNGLRVTIPAGRSPFAPDQPVTVVVTRRSSSAVGGPDQSADVVGTTQRITGERPGSDKSWECELHFDGHQWQQGPANETSLRKRHNLQGPIDDAFMDSFLVVRPTGQARHEAVGRWSTQELDHLVREWRRQFRGDAVVKRDVDVTQADIAANHLILFGDPGSNAVIASIMDKLPVQWTAEQIVIGDKTFDASHHAPLLIYPNPMNPQRYVVLNSGFTFREYAYLNNARQVPKLPDWAVVDLRTPPDSLWPGRIADAGFFDEHWKLKQ